MISLEAIIVVIGWAVSMSVALFIVPRLAAQKTMRKFGLIPVRNSEGEEIYAVEGPDGDPIKVPVQRVDKDGKASVADEYVPLAYALPVIAAVQTKAFLTASIYGKAGKLTQNANNALLESMDINQAANAMALQAFAKGQYGKALMAYLTPKIAASINASSAAGQAGEQSGNPPRSGHSGKAI
jgi:hypothetical protein